jgi:hypothetical protein
MANSDTKLVNELYTLAATLGGEYESGEMWDWETVHEAALRLSGNEYKMNKIYELCDRACGEDADLDHTEALMQIWELVNPGVLDPSMSKPIEGRDPECSISSNCSVDKKGWERGVEEAAKGKKNG